MKYDQSTVEQQLYNLILNPATRDWKRQLLVQAKSDDVSISFQNRMDRLTYGRWRRVIA